MRLAWKTSLVTLTNDYDEGMNTRDAFAQNVSRNVEEGFVGIDTTEALLNTEHAYVFELERI